MTARLGLLLLVSTVCPSRAQDIKSVPVTGKIEWTYSYAEGQKLARASGKPIFVVFRCER